MILNGVKFKKLSIGDKNLFFDIYNKQDYKVLSYEDFFDLLYAYDRLKSNRNVYWKLEGDLFVKFYYYPKKNILEVIGSPLKVDGSAISFDDIKIIRDWTRTATGQKNTRFTNFADGHDLNRPFFGNRFAPKEQDALWVDFIYDTENLIGMQGKVFATKRRVVNKFVKENSFVVRPYEPEDKKAVMEVRKLWLAGMFPNKKRLNEEICWDLKVFPFLLENYRKLDIDVYVFEVNGKIEGFTTVLLLNDSIFSVYQTNCNKEIIGLSVYMMIETCRRTFESNKELKYMNFGNAGEKTDGLYRYKSDFNPLPFVNKYHFTF